LLHILLPLHIVLLLHIFFSLHIFSFLAYFCPCIFFRPKYSFLRLNFPFLVRTTFDFANGGVSFRYGFGRVLYPAKFRLSPLITPVLPFIFPSPPRLFIHKASDTPFPFSARIISFLAAKSGFCFSLSPCFSLSYDPLGGWVEVIFELVVECGEFHKCCGVQVLVLGCIDGLWLVEVGLFITDKCDLVSVSESEHDIGWVIGFGAWSW